MTEQSEKISKAVEELKQDIFLFIQQAVQYTSLPDQEGPVQKFIAAKLQSLGLDVEIVTCRFDEIENHPAFCNDGFSANQRINVIGRWYGTEKTDTEKQSLILNGHVDVVPVGKESLWDDSPWSGRIENGKLYGRGSCDMKAGLSAGIFAIQALQCIGFEPDRELILESVVGEESGGLGTLTTIVKGIQADGVIILEPTNLQVCPIQSGALTFRLTIPGLSTHASVKWEGINAIDKFDLIYHTIHNLEKERHKLYVNPYYNNPNRVAPINLGTIRGGTWHSTVPEEVTVEGRLGVFPGESIEEARLLLEKSIYSISENDPWLHDNPPEIEWIEGQYEPGETSPDNPLVQVLLSSHEIMTGIHPTIRGVTYGSDLRLFTNHAHIPAVLYGPGNVKVAHSANEYVELEKVLTATKVIAYMIYQWCGGIL